MYPDSFSDVHIQRKFKLFVTDSECVVKLLLQPWTSQPLDITDSASGFQVTNCFTNQVTQSSHDCYIWQTSQSESATRSLVTFGLFIHIDKQIAEGFIHPHPDRMRGHI